MVSCIKFKVQEMYKVNKGRQARVRVGLRAMPPGVTQPAGLGGYPCHRNPFSYRILAMHSFCSLA